MIAALLGLGAVQPIATLVPEASTVGVAGVVGAELAMAEVAVEAEKVVYHP